jgi:RNA polymerase sigma-32 factor
MQDRGTAVIQNDRNSFDGAGARAYARGYASTIRQFDLLEQGEEQQLARRWQEHGDRRATDALVTSHLRLAAKVARRYQGYGLPLADLIAEANLGLAIAASRFEPDRGSRFSTYALWWIKAAIYDYILRSWSLVKIGTTSAQRKLFFGLRREMRKFAGGTIGLTPEVAEAVAQELEVTPRDVTEMNSRLSGDLSLNTPVYDDGRTTEWEAMLVDDSPNAEAIVAEQDENARQSNALRAALDVLTERERRVFEARRLAEDPPSLEQLGRELSISGERVRQIETSAFAKIKRAATEYLKREDSSRLPAPVAPPIRSRHETGGIT